MKKFILPLILILLLTFTLIGDCAWLSGYVYRKKVTINGSVTGIQTNYQMKLTVNKGMGVSSGDNVYLENHASSWTGTTPRDIRFTTADGSTLLDYWIESSDANNAVVWIEFDSIRTTYTDFYIYYGKSGDAITSNGDDTFPDLFDHFDRSDLNPNPIGDFGSWPRNRASYVVGNYAYVTHWNSVNGGQVSSVDITDKSSPSVLDTLTIGGHVLDIVVDGDYAYIANGYYSGDSFTNKLVVVNISNPNSLSIEGSIEDAINLIGSHGIYKSGDYVYCCCYLDDCFTIVDVSTPSGPSVRGHVRDADQLKGAHDVFVEGNYAYVSCHWSGTANHGTFTIINISDKDNPLIVKSIHSADLYGSADIQKKGNYCWVGRSSSVEANRYIRSIDVSDVNNPFIAGELTGYGAYVSAIFGDYLYGADNYEALNVVDISTPTSPSFVRQYSVCASDSCHVFLTSDGNYAVIARWQISANEKFYIIDVTLVPNRWNKLGSPSLSSSICTLENGEADEWIENKDAYGINKALRFRAKSKQPEVHANYAGFDDTTDPVSSNSKHRTTAQWNADGNINALGGNAMGYYITALSGLSFDTYYNIDIIRTGSHDKYYFDGALKADETSYPSSNDRYIAFYYNQCGISCPLLIDWVLLRNYISPEPTWGTWGNEEVVANVIWFGTNF